MIDLNEDQGTLTKWWIQRGRPVNPYLHEADGTVFKPGPRRDVLPQALSVVAPSACSMRI